MPPNPSRPTYPYLAPGPLFRDADHHNELLELAHRHDSLHSSLIDHTSPGNPYADFDDEPLDPDPDAPDAAV